MIWDMGLYIEGERLGHYAENTARQLLPDGRVGCGSLKRHLNRDLADILSCCAALASGDFGRDGPPEAASWLIDNRYLAVREGRGLLGDLKYLGSLPGLPNAPSGPVVTELARALLRSGRGEVSMSRLEIFLASAQDVRVLEERELQIFIPMLKLAAVEAVAKVARDTLRLCQNGNNKQLSGFGDTCAALFTSLRFLSREDFSPLLEAQSRTEAILCKDPAGAYANMDEESRAYYRSRLAQIALRLKLPEHEAALKALDLAEASSGRKNHIGYYILENPLGRGFHRRNPSGYISVIVLCALFLTLLSAFLAGSPWVALLLICPLLQAVKNVVDYVVTRSCPRKHIPAMDLKDGVPREGRTLCVISALLTDAQSARRLAKALEEFRLTSRSCGENLLFGLLADLPDCPTPISDADTEILAAAREAVAELDRRYGGFFFFSRPRSYNPRDRVWSGYERKRGALGALMDLVSGRASALTAEGSDSLAGVRYLITLDADTRLTVGAAKKLIGAIMHPLNLPVIQGGRVVLGHGIIQSAIGVELEASVRTRFSRIFAGQGGLDPYSGSRGEVYQDLFGRGSFTGKGIINIAAYTACLRGVFPMNRILSHDLLEGEYLAAGLISRVELTDGFPARINSYYTRLHRWVRGDWQAGAWLLSSVPSENGRCKNPLPALSKWKIFDNLRRSLVAAFTFAALLAGIFSTKAILTTAALVALLCFLSGLFLSGADKGVSGKYRRQRLGSGIVVGVRGVFVQTFLGLILLPYEALVSLSAILTALFRLHVSKKRLLDWVTASQGDQRKSAYLRRMLPVMAAGALCLVFSAHPLGAAAGIIWLLSPLVCLYLDSPGRPKKPLGTEGRNFLLNEARQMWAFFDETLSSENNWLPPDNVQILPYKGAARRTSPTNIGLALLSITAAKDLDFISEVRLLELLEKTLDSIDALEKWRGHLYNWYSTADLSPMQPSVVSSVDSGNLAGCLIACGQALSELGSNEANLLAQRCFRLWQDMDFACLYSEKKRLFHLSADPVTGQLSDGFYDLMESEARQTSYIAVASGQVPPRHWKMLGRAQLRFNGFQGMASWTGTMFEYLMPDLLLPRFESSSLSESALFCVYAQQKRVQKGQVWGVSESAFALLDESLCYRYKASGVQALGLKTGLDRDLVVSPYSSFLALSVAPNAAIKNLRALRELGICGKYGLYEAADFTPSRLSSRLPFESVACYMAHHVGMSIVSVDNALSQDIMRRRFMRERAMGAYAELLKEKIPVDAPVISAFFDEPPEPSRHRPPVFSDVFKDFNPEIPRCAPLSNGSYFLSAADTGEVREVCRGRTLMRFDPENGAGGLGVWLWTGGELLSLTPGLRKIQGNGFSWTRAGDRIVWEISYNGIESRLTLAVITGADAALREVQINNLSGKILDGELIFAGEPVMASDDAYAAHPAFSKLFIETRIHENAVEFCRRGGSDACQMVFAVSGATLEADTSRPKAFGRGGLDGLKQALGRPAGNTGGAVTDPCLLARCRLSVMPGDSVQVKAALAFGGLDEALGPALKTARASEKEFSRKPGYDAGLMDMDSGQLALACAMLSAVMFPPSSPLSHGRELLWKHGVSGSLPIIAALADPQTDLPGIFGIIRRFMWLKMSGIRADLVFVVMDDPGYRQPVRDRVCDAVTRLGGEGMIGKSGGIHILSGLSKKQAEGVSAFACFIPGQEQAKRRMPPRCWMPSGKSNKPPTGTFGREGNYTLEISGNLPLRAMSHVLATPTFGALFAETGCFGMWQGNARENKLLPWVNDPLAVADGLQLQLDTHLGKLSLFARDDGHHCSVNYFPGYAVWEKRVGPGETVKTTAFAALNADALVVIVSGAEGTLLSQPRIIMGADSSDSRWVERLSAGSFECYTNAFNTDFSPQMVMTAASHETTGDRIFVIGCASVEQGRDKIRGLLRPESARNELAAVKVYWQGLCGKLRIQSPYPLLNNYVNQWAPYQIIACRLFARCSIYQCGGAFGFRDQLQDVCAVIPIAPELAKTQILRSCENQFLQGDVAHWWHELKNGRRGVRTLYSDDLLWLPYAIALWARQTGDMSLLDRQVPYLEADPLKQDEKDRYFQFSACAVSESVLLHGKRALDLALARGCGPHGLSKILGGDWNDGMNRVGPEGKGESLWLTCLLVMVIEDYVPLIEAAGLPAGPYLEQADKYRQAIADAFRGNRFIRGYFDCGNVIGAPGCSSCSVDAISQAFAALVLSGDNAQTGIQTAINALYTPENRLVRLFDPPFDREAQDPGYIQNYPPGIRENGGQYTHGAVWLALGAFRAGLYDQGRALMLALLPGGRDEKVYQAEPYVLCADIYSGENAGTGGWSWYTGAAGWYYRVALEHLAGLDMREGVLFKKAGADPEVKLFVSDTELPEAESSAAVSAQG